MRMPARAGRVSSGPDRTVRAYPRWAGDGYAVGLDQWAIVDIRRLQDSLPGRCQLLYPAGHARFVDAAGKVQIVGRVAI